MITSIFFDIDGTLVSFQTHEVPENTFAALKKLKEKGVRLFIATGRGKDGLAVLKNFPLTIINRPEMSALWLKRKYTSAWPLLTMRTRRN